MIPGGDHCSRAILHRRVTNYSDISNNVIQQSFEGMEDECFDGMDNNNNYNGMNPNSSNDNSHPYSRVEDDDVDEEQEAQRRQRQQEALNSTSFCLFPNLDLEYEQLSDDDDIDDGTMMSLFSLATRWKKTNWRLWVVFTLLVVSGVGNVILAKLQSQPMYNYPTFLNMYANFAYIILSFGYIIPASAYRWFNNSIPWNHLTNMSKKPFIVMGCLDAISAAMQVLATVYLPGTLVVLLPQVAIPLSMLASRFILRETYTIHQYVGAVVVMVGIVVVLFPVLTHQHTPEFSCQAASASASASAAYDNDDASTSHYCSICQIEETKEDCLSYHIRQQQQHDDDDDDTGLSFLRHDESSAENSNGLYNCVWVSRNESIRHDDALVVIWSIILIISCIPMVLSSIYKQVALQVDLDPILVNGFAALFQFICGIPVLVPAGLVSSPRVMPWQLPTNWKQATQCLFSHTNTIDSGCHPDDCHHAALYVHLGLISSIIYTLSMILVLKYGSSSLLYVGLTVTVPVSHLIFSLRTPSTVQLMNVIGLIVILIGLILFRFGHEKGNTTNHPSSSSSNNGYNLLSNSNNSTTHGNQGRTDGLLHHSNNRNNNNNNSNATTTTTTSDGGFLEFLREPFLLVGDI